MAKSPAAKKLEELPRRFLSIARSYASNDPKPEKKTYITIGCLESVDGGWVEKPKEKYPHPATDDFHEAFDALKAFVVEYAGLSKSQAAQLVVISVVFKHSKEGACDVILNAARPLTGFNQPKIETIPKHAPSGDELKAIEDLEAEAVAFIEGKRGQLELVADSSGEDDSQLQLGEEDDA